MSNSSFASKSERHMNQYAPTPKPQFTITVPRIVIEIEIPVALRLGDFIVEHSPPDKALMALGHQLQNISPPEKD